MSDSEFGSGPGVGKQAKDLNDTLKQTLNHLTHMDRLITNMAANSGAIKGSIGGLGGGGITNRGGGGLGVGTNMMASALGNISTRGAGVAAGVAAGLGVGSAVMSLMPNMSQVLPIQTMGYQSGALLGMSGQSQMNGVRSAMGNGMSSATEAGGVAATFANYGISSNSGLGKQMLGNVAGMYNAFGTSNSAAGSAMMGLYGNNANYWRANMLGISMMDSKGQQRGVGDVALQAYRRLYGNKRVSSTEILSMNGTARADIKAITGGDASATQMILSQMGRIGNNGGKNISLDKTTPTPAGSTWTAQGKLNAASYNLATGSVANSEMAGYNKALGYATDASLRVANSNLALVKAMGYASGFGSGVNGTALGSAGSGLMNGVTTGAGILAARGILQSTLGRVLPSGASKFLGLTKDVSTATNVEQSVQNASRLSGRLGVIADRAPIVGATFAAAMAGETAILNHTGVGQAGLRQVNGLVSFLDGNHASNVSINRRASLSMRENASNAWNHAHGLSLGSPGAATDGFSGAQVAASKASLLGGKGGGGVVTSAGAMKFATGQTGKSSENWYQACDHFVGRAYGYSSSGYHSAIIHWNSIPAKLKHPGDRNAPKGALLFWAGGDFGHAALSMGGGQIASTDILRAGKVDIVPLGLVATKWGFKYLGWSVPYFHGTVKPMVGGSAVRGAAGLALGVASTTALSSMIGGSIGASIGGATPLGGGSVVGSDLAGMLGSGDTAGLLGGGASGQIGYTPGRSHTGSAGGGSAGTSASGSAGVPAYAGKNLNLASLIKGAGFTGSAARMAYAIAMAESSGREGARNRNKDGTLDVGVFQLNSSHSAWLNMARAGTDAKYNAHVAFEMSKSGTDWSQWSTYKNGKYKQFLAGAPGYSQGAWRVQGGQVANVHDGEMIIPASAAEKVRTASRDAISGSKKAGERKTNIYVTIAQASEADALRLARTVKRILDEDSNLDSIGSDH